MAMATGIYGQTLMDCFDGSDQIVDFTNDTIQYALYDDTETPNFDGATSAYSATNEIAGTGYVAKGYTLANKAIDNGSTNANYVTFDNTVDPNWTSADLSAIRGAIVFDDTLATPQVDPQIMAVTFGSDYAVTSGTFTAQLSADGLYRFHLTA